MLQNCSLDTGILQLLARPLALGLHLHEGFETQLLLMVQFKERLMGLVEDSNGPDDLD